MTTAETAITTIGMDTLVCIGKALGTNEPREGLEGVGAGERRLGATKAMNQRENKLVKLVIDYSSMTSKHFVTYQLLIAVIDYLLITHQLLVF